MAEARLIYVGIEVSKTQTRAMLQVVGDVSDTKIGEVVNVFWENSRPTTLKPLVTDSIVDLTIWDARWSHGANLPPTVSSVLSLEESQN